MIGLMIGLMIGKEKDSASIGLMVVKVSTHWLQHRAASRSERYESSICTYCWICWLELVLGVSLLRPRSTLLWTRK